MKEKREFFSCHSLFLPTYDLEFRFCKRAPLGVQVDREQSPARAPSAVPISLPPSRPIGELTTPRSGPASDSQVSKHQLESPGNSRRSRRFRSNRRWRHELDYDAESVLWLLLYWVLILQPVDSLPELVDASTWPSLMGTVLARITMLEALSLGRLVPGLTHSVYEPLLPLLKKPAAIISIDRH